MNEPSRPSHVIELRVPSLSGQGKAVVAVLALGVAVFAGWAIGHHTSAPQAMRPYAPAPIAAATAEQSMPAPAALPQVQTPSSYTAPRQPVIENTPTTLTEVVPAEQAPVVTPPAPTHPALTAKQRLQDAIENQAAATGQTPAEVIEQLNPSGTSYSSSAPSTVVSAPAPAPQTVVVQSPPAVYPTYYSYPYYGYGYPYYGYGYGYPYVGVGLNFNFGHGGHFGGWHR